MPDFVKSTYPKIQAGQRNRLGFFEILSKNKNGFRIEYELKELQSGRFISFDPLCFLKNSSGEVSIKGQIFSQYEPVDFELTIDANIIPNTIDMEAFYALADDTD